MFEKSLANTNGGRRPLSFLISLGSQVILIGAAVALSIASAPALPMAEWTRVMLTPPSPPPAPPPPPSVQPTPVRTTAVFDPLQQPTKIPEKVAVIVDDHDFRPSLPRVNYVVGGDPTGVVPDGVLNSIGTPQVAPPPPPVPKVEPKPEPPSGPIRVSSTIQAAKLIRRIEPTYPRLAVQARIEGTVKLHAVISPQGSIEKLRVLSGHPLLVSAAVQAVKQWRYRPTMLGQVAVPVETQVDVIFKLR